MKTLIQTLAVAAAAAGLCAIILPARAVGTISEQRIAVVDLQKVFEKYYKTVRSQAALKEEASELQKEREDMVDSGKKLEAEWQKLMDKAEDQAVSAAERANSKKAAEDKFREVKSSEQALQEYDRASTVRMQEKQRQRHDDIVKEIRNELNAEAKAAGYTLVLDVSGDSANTVPVVIYSTGVNDMTDNLIRELNAAAPATAADDKASK